MDAVNPKLKLHIRKMHEYQDGRHARLNQKRQSDCPYPPRSGDNRTAWLAGWFDMHYELRWPDDPVVGRGEPVNRVCRQYHQ